MDSLANLKATELRLAPPGAADSMMTAGDAAKGNKRLLPETHRACLDELEEGSHGPAAKAQVVGWPPVRSFRRNNTGAREAKVADENAAIYVKVGMDGAPYLRKIDLRVYQGYKDLRGALEGMFKCYSSLEEGGDGPEYVITYEDKDGDWMMVGDVPWEMFISSCKRLRIMKGSDARGLASSQ